MKRQLTTPPATTPVDESEVKDNLRIESADDDTLIGTLISQSVEYAEHYCGRSFMSQVWTYYFDAWNTEFLIHSSPVQSVAVKYIDDNDVEQTVPPADYELDNKAYPAVVRFRSGASSVIGPAFNGVRIEATCGYPAGEVPEAANRAVLLLVGHWYENAEESTQGNLTPIPHGAPALLNTIKVNISV